jgi:CRP/FNR family transcriptional regulator
MTLERISDREFPQLPVALRQELERDGDIRHFKKGETILRENMNIRAIPIVLKGSLRVLRQEPDGREILLYYVGPGESCIMSLYGGMHNSPSLVKAEAAEDTEILQFPADKAGEWIRRYPEWTEFILSLYHKRFEELLNIVNEVAFQKLEDRVYNLLLKKAQLLQSSELQTTHQQLAEELGTSREVISRQLKQLEKEGRIVLNRNKISLK